MLKLQFSSENFQLREIFCEARKSQFFRISYFIINNNAGENSLQKLRDKYLIRGA